MGEPKLLDQVRNLIRAKNLENCFKTTSKAC